MRNRFPGVCYRCGLTVKAGEGHFERNQGRWRVQHAKCAIQYREMRNNVKAKAKRVTIHALEGR